MVEEDFAPFSITLTCTDRDLELRDWRKCLHQENIDIPQILIQDS